MLTSLSVIGSLERYGEVSHTDTLIKIKQLCIIAKDPSVRGRRDGDIRNQLPNPGRVFKCKPNSIKSRFYKIVAVKVFIYDNGFTIMWYSALAIYRGYFSSYNSRKIPPSGRSLGWRSWVQIWRFICCNCCAVVIWAPHNLDISWVYSIHMFIDEFI